MEVVTVTGIEVHKDVARNMSRIIGREIFKHKNINPIVTINSPTHAYIKFIEISDVEYARPLCQINIFMDRYALNGSISKGTVYLYSKGFIIDRWRVYRWLRGVIKEFRRKS